MSKWIHCADRGVGSFTINSNETLFIPVNGASFSVPTEAHVQNLIRGTYTASNLWVNVISITGTNTLRTRVGGANGGQSISITTTGTKEDTSGTDSLVNGNLFNFSSFTSNSHNNTCKLDEVSVLLDDNGSNIPILMNSGSDSVGTGASFMPISGSCIDTATEASAQVTLQASATLSNFRMYLSANSFADSTTWRTRVNGANASQSVSYATLVTGEKEDTTNTDAVAVADELCFGKDSGGTSGTATVTVMQAKSASAAFQPFFCDVGIASHGANITNYRSLGGGGGGANSESDSQLKSRVADTFKNMQTNVTANTRSDATTVDFRANAASPGGGPSISVGAGSTGIKEDLSGSYTTSTTDSINYRVVTGAGTGSITLTTVGAQQGAGAAAAPVGKSLVWGQAVRRAACY